MPKRKQKTVQNPLVSILVFLLFFDGTVRILFSTLIYFILPELYGPVDVYFHLRWFSLGLLDLVFAYGLSVKRIWPLYGLALLSLIRIYTIFTYPPQGIFLPLHSNFVTYAFKILMMVLVFYLLAKRSPD